MGATAQRRGSGGAGLLGDRRARRPALHADRRHLSNRRTQRRPALPRDRLGRELRWSIGIDRAAVARANELRIRIQAEASNGWKFSVSLSERVDGSIGSVAEGQPRIGPGAIGLRPRAKSRQRPPAASIQAPLPLPACHVCGVILEGESDRKRRRGSYCPECLAERRIEVGELIQSTPTPRRGDRDTSARRSAANAEHRLAEQGWELAHEGDTFDRERFATTVVPGLKSVTLTTIAKATGCPRRQRQRFGRGPGCRIQGIGRRWRG